ncbi:MAG: NUDIX domain-containing protein [Candidatus Heimdallarchaeota archaeon]
MTENSDEIGFFGGYRIAGIMVKEGKVLLQSDEYNDFWTTPGGGVKIFESSEEALKREFQEELEADITVERLLYIVENSFKKIQMIYLIKKNLLELKMIFTMRNMESSNLLFDGFL